MYSISELVKQCEVPLKAIERSMDAKGSYHPDDAKITDGLSRSVAKDVMESIRRIPLQEYLTRSGASTTAGIAGANYLIPVKLYDQLIYAARDYDITPQIASVMINGWSGGQLDVPIVVDESYWGQIVAGGARIPDEGPAFTKATLDPILIATNIVADNSLLEDNGVGLMDWCVRQAASAIAWKENRNTISVLQAGADGDGTLNSSATGDTNETKFTSGTTSDIVTTIRRIGDDRFIPDTLLITSEAWGHSVGVNQVPVGWDVSPPREGFNTKLGILDVLFNNSMLMHASTDADGAAFTKCKTVVFDRRNALVAGRKRWMQIERYAHPTDDLTGAVVSARVDAVTAFADSIYVLTET